MCCLRECLSVPRLKCLQWQRFCVGSRCGSSEWELTCSFASLELIYLPALCDLLTESRGSTAGVPWSSVFRFWCGLLVLPLVLTNMSASCTHPERGLHQIQIARRIVLLFAPRERCPNLRTTGKQSAARSVPPQKIFWPLLSELCVHELLALMLVLLLLTTVMMMVMMTMMVIDRDCAGHHAHD